MSNPCRKLIKVTRERMTKVYDSQPLGGRQPSLHFVWFPFTSNQDCSVWPREYCGNDQL